MARYRFDKSSGKFLEIEDWHAAQNAPESKRGDVAAPMVISDCMDALIHPATGLYSDSKSSFRKMTKASGCVEIGDQAPVENCIPDVVGTREAKADRVSEIKQAMGKL